MHRSTSLSTAALGVAATRRARPTCPRLSSMPARISFRSISTMRLKSMETLMIMADQVRRAIAWVYKNAASFGGDANRLYVSGTSSGAHLAAVALTTDWRKDFGLPADMLKGGLCCSGMYDLHPVSLSARAGY